MKNKITCLFLAIVMILSSFPITVFAKSSIGSNADNTSIGEDYIFGTKTEYTEVGVSNTETQVYLSVEDNNLIASLPTTIIVNGTPNSSGEYIGEYSIGVSGDMSGNKTVTIEPESNTIALKQSGKNDKTASIIQEKTKFDVDDFKNNTTTKGNIIAKQLTAGSWYGEFEFNIYTTTTEYSTDFITTKVFGENCNLRNGLAIINTEQEQKLTHSHDDLYEIYFLPLADLGVSTGDKIILSNKDNNGYMMSINVYDTSLNKTQGTKSYIVNDNSESVTISASDYAIGFSVIKSNNNTTAVNSREFFEKARIPIKDFKLYKNSISTENEINYISVWNSMLKYDEEYNFNYHLNLHNADPDQTEHLKEVIETQPFDMWDVDLRKTKDNIWVNCHNETINSYTISQTNFSTLKSSIAEISSLDELLKYAKANNIILQIEIKCSYNSDDIKAIYNEIINHNMISQVYYSQDIYTKLKGVADSLGYYPNFMVYDTEYYNCTKEQMRLLKNNNNVIINTSINYHDTLDSDTLAQFISEGFYVEIGLNHTEYDNIVSYLEMYRQYSGVIDKLFSVKTEAGCIPYLIAANRYINGM